MKIQVQISWVGQSTNHTAHFISRTYLGWSGFFYFTRLFLWLCVCLCRIPQKTKLCDCWKLWGIITPFLSLHHKHSRNFFRWKMYKITILKNMTRILDPVTCPLPKNLLWTFDFFHNLTSWHFPGGRCFVQDRIPRSWDGILCRSWRLLVTNLGNGNVDRTTELHQLKTNYQVLNTTTITSTMPCTVRYMY